jgi:hypothetical protein
MWKGNSTYEPFEDPLHLLLDIFQAAVRIQDTVYDQVYKPIKRNNPTSFKIYQALVSRAKEQLFYKK